MLTIHSDLHRKHHGRYELMDGEFHPPVEKPERVEQIIGAVRERGFGDIREPDAHADAWVGQIHTRDYVEFLRTAWDAWRAVHGDIDALPLNWPARHMRDIRPTAIDGLLGYYSLDAASPIMAGTWEAINSSADVALTGAATIAAGESRAFSLCRPPGHHAASDSLAGYCYFNNAALAAQYLRTHGFGRVAIIDVDYHHGNGTQTIFEARSDVLFISIHADPFQEFPYFLGHAEETGVGAGEGYNLNLPLRWGTDWDGGYARALDTACSRIAEYGADAVVVSLGVDTYEGDPISRFCLKAADFPRVGQMLRGLERPTLFVMEGGYAVDALGQNVCSVLEGFERGPA